MAEKINYQTVRQDYKNLRDKQQSLQMATLSADGFPEASYAPFVWFESACYLFLSQLAKHSQNLSVNPSLSLLLIEDEADTRNQFARRRIIWQGQAEVIKRDSELFKRAMQSFRDRFGDFIDLIEPLQDFQLYKVTLRSGRFIRGFAQAFQLYGEGLSEMSHIGPNGSQVS